MYIIKSRVDSTSKIVYKDGNYHYYSITFCQDLEEDDVLTVCISTQVGCSEKCKFCATGDHNLIRNLTVQEIAREILDWINCMKNYIEKNDIPTLHIICEGMGEASRNINNCFGALIEVYPEISNRFQKIVFRVSTIGNIELVKNYIDFVHANGYLKTNIEFQIKLSLHTPFDIERLYLSTNISKRYRVNEILKEFYSLADVLNTKLICNYVLFDYPNGGNNYSDIHKLKLSNILKPEKTKLLLGKYSETGKGFISPEESIYNKWYDYFNLQCGIKTEKTSLKGSDIGAACGMLDYK